MQILLTNDDGIFAPGLAAIYKELTKIGDVLVVAPSNGQSGMSHSITFQQPVLCHEVEVKGLFKGFSVDGSPADCVKLACMQLSEKPIDLIVAGINEGANVGINIYYSGTVAAAMEGAFLQIPSVAMSAAYQRCVDFEQSAKYCFSILEEILPLDSGQVININIPPLKWGNPKGIRAAQQSVEGFEEFYEKKTNPQGQIVFQLSGGPHRDEDVKSDTILLGQGYITVTALSPGMTNFKKTNELGKKLSRNFQ